MYVCTFLEDGVSEKRVVYTDTNEDKISLMVRKILPVEMKHTSFLFIKTIPFFLLLTAPGLLFD